MDSRPAQEVNDIIGEPPDDIVLAPPGTILKTSSGKIPVYIQMKNGHPFGMAGLFSDWNSPEGDKLRTCTIITTQPNDLLAPIHNRMPAIIGQEHRNLWLDPDINDPVTLIALLGSYPSDEMEMWEVSRIVHTPANNSPENIEPV